MKPTSGAAVTIDSNHKVINEGTIEISNVNGARGVVANAGTVGSITNAATGKITIDEPYAPTDIDNDGDIDGAFALAATASASRPLGAFTGNIVNSGAITIEGNDLAGIRLGGPLTGNFTNDGTVSVLGDRALGVGLQDVTGNVRLAGTITATGLDATAARLTGNITGALVVQGSLTATGYRFTTPPADPSKLDADDLLIGGPALSVEGNVTGGIVLAVPPKDNSTTDNDEDKDGIPDDKEGSAAVRLFGSAAAVRIGSTTQSVTIGPVAGTGTGLGLIIDGGVIGNGPMPAKTETDADRRPWRRQVTIAGGIGIGATGSSVGGTVERSCGDGNPDRQRCNHPRIAQRGQGRGDDRRKCSRSGRNRGARRGGRRRCVDPQQRYDRGENRWRQWHCARDRRSFWQRRCRREQRYDQCDRGVGQFRPQRGDRPVGACDWRYGKADCGCIGRHRAEHRWRRPL
ncbi:hypothetical protein [Sphingopyxis sp.]|uniref:hypothetical protein n=1 Tax=Sphingopyxis sp. TaxID=1908224 RepID=UPI0025E697A3|nr:hypothetical protein [Sphingopyxis sp.]MBK6413244.1 hypothetical protein [Sphingopyxis sp.]